MILAGRPFKMRLIKKLNINDITEDNFYRYRLSLINFRISYNNYINRYSVTIFIQEQKLMNCMTESEPTSFYTFANVNFRKSIPKDLHVHKEYLYNLFNCLMTYKSTFLNIKYLFFNIDDHFLTRERINCIMLKF
ncbi:hypothetical protein COBT_002581, partial [Conglomerata obtusa]